MTKENLRFTVTVEVSAPLTRDVHAIAYLYTQGGFLTAGRIRAGAVT